MYISTQLQILETNLLTFDTVQMLYHETMIVIRYVLPTFVLALNLVFPVELECLQTELVPVGVQAQNRRENPQPRKATNCFSKFWLNIRSYLEKLSIFEER